VTGSVCNRYVFRISVNLAQNVKAAAMLAAETDVKVWTTIGPDYAFGHQSWEYFEKYLKEIKADATFLPKDDVAFPPFKTTDFNPYINKIMQSKADGVLVSLWGGNLIDFVRQAKEMGVFDGKRQVLVTLGAATEVLSALGDKMPEGLWVGTRYWFLANDSQRNNAFVKAYKDRYGDYPSYNAHGAYGALYTYKAAAEKAGTVDKEKVIDALEGMTVELPVGKITIRPEDHQALTDVTWGKTAADAAYPIRILDPIKLFDAAAVTPSVAESGCKK
jgi:branched-chain amino acid transport system substrate-binding protein